MYPETKVYHDGSHFVAIPHTEGISKSKPRIIEEEAIVYEEQDKETQKSCKEGEISENEVYDNETTSTDTESDDNEPKRKPAGETKSQIFNRLFDDSKEMKKRERKAYIMKEMRKYFRSNEEEKEFVEKKLTRKALNLVNRRLRLSRKANLNEFNYFSTFTRNDELMDEKSFRKKLKKTLENFATRRGWQYIGVWERSPTGRLHFHSIINVPEGTMPGKIIEVNDYDTRSKMMRRTNQNTYFNERFGRTDFESIPKSGRGKDMAVKYLTKYLEKTGERIVYSRNLPMFLISDIEEQDVLATLQNEYGKKLVLHDKFNLWDEGEYIGEMSAKNKKRLRTANS